MVFKLDHSLVVWLPVLDTVVFETSAGIARHLIICKAFLFLRLPDVYVTIMCVHIKSNVLCIFLRMVFIISELEDTC
jgi:hypothetical protein